MKFKNFILPLLCAILFSCEGVPIDPSKMGESVQLNAVIAGMSPRASDTSWEANDAIGVFMKKAGSTLGTSALSQNVKYVTTGTSVFSPANESDKLYFPFDGSNVDFIGYYPFRESISGFMYPVDVSNQSDQAVIDLLYSDNATALNSDDPNVEMAFSHQLSKVVLNIQHDANRDLSELSVIITNVGTNTTFSLTDGSLSPPSDTGDLVFKASTDGTSAEAILLPDTDLSGQYLWFIIGEDEEVYTYPLNSALEINSFEKSTKYTYNITLHTDREAVIAKGIISDWIEGPSVNGIADRTTEQPPIIKGTKKDPYTVIEARENQGKTGVWVKGYIVGSFTGTINNFFPGNTGESTTNIALADSKDETDTSKMIPVNLSEASAAIRSALNIPDNHGNVNKKVMIKGNLAAYFSAPGLRDLKDYEFIDE